MHSATGYGIAVFDQRQHLDYLKRRNMIDKKLKDFATLVKKMREAQKNFYKDKPIVGSKVAYANMRNKEYQVDRWLEELL